MTTAAISTTGVRIPLQLVAKMVASKVRMMMTKSTSNQTQDMHLRDELSIFVIIECQDAKHRQAVGSAKTPSSSSSSLSSSS